MFTTTAHRAVSGLSRQLAYALLELEIQSLDAVACGQSTMTTSKIFFAGLKNRADSPRSPGHGSPTTCGDVIHDSRGEHQAALCAE